MNYLESSQLQAAPLMNSEIIKKNQINTFYNNKMFPLDISLSIDNIIFQLQEKYCLYYYQKQLSFQQFLNLHKYFRFFDNLSEIYDDLINNKADIKIKDVKSDKISLLLKVKVNKNDYEINFELDKKEFDKIKDIDIILYNYNMMKKELDELKNKYNLNDNDYNLFDDSLWLKNNNKFINLIKEGIKHQLNKNIINTRLIYKYSKDGSKIDIFHQKCDGISNTLVIGESEHNRIFGGFTTQKWDSNSESKKDDYAFLFQLNDMKIYYAIKGKGGIFCRNDFGATFGNNEHFCFCFQDNMNKGLNREDENNNNIGFDYYGNKNRILEGNHTFNLKDYEVFELLLI